MMPIFSYYNYVQLASVILGVLFLHQIQKASLSWLFFLSMAGFLVDLASRWVIIVGYPNNYFIINLYHTIAAPIIFYGFYGRFELKPLNRKIYLMSSTIIVIVFITSYFYYYRENEFATIPIVFYNFFNSILCCGMLFKMAMQEKVFSFSEEPMFWISSSILIFSLGALVTMGMSQYIRANHLTIQNRALYQVIMPVLNVILYGSFCYVFILCRVKKKSYLPLL